MSDAVVVARALDKRFGRSEALRGVDLTLRERHCLALLGPNGAGKSTLLRLVAGLSRPSGGTLQVAGLPAAHPKARARIGYVGHATLLYPALTARENLIFAGRLHAVPAVGERADARLAEEGLEAVSARRVGDFSRGMAQRLSIARALMHDPELLLLDEPFTGLDRRAAGELSRRLRDLRDRGRSLLLVTHDPHRAAEMADCAVVLRRGRVALALERPPESETLERALEEAAA